MLYKLSDIFDLQMGKTPSRDNNMYWKGGNLPWVSIADLSKSHIYIENSKEMITNLAAKDTLMKCIPQDTVIMSFKLSLGKTAITRIPLYTNEAIMAFIDKKVIPIEPKYIYFLFSHIKWEQYTNSAVKGKTLNKKFFSDFQINIPKYIQQKKITSILIRINKILEYKHCLIKAYDALIKSRFVEMFGNPIINDKKYPVFKLKDISQKIGSGVTPRGGDSNYIDKGVAFIRSMNVYNNTFKKENLVYIDESLAKQFCQVELFSNDLLLNITGASVARCCTVPDDILPARVNQHVCIIRQCRISNVFLEYCLTNESYQEYLLLLSNKNGATREALTKIQVENLEVIFPPLTEITRFVKIVHQINKLKSDVQKSIDETQLLMDSLMQEYFG